MKVRHFFLVSLALHAAVFLAVTLPAGSRGAELYDLSYLEVRDFESVNPELAVARNVKQEGDMTPTEKMKETNRDTQDHQASLSPSGPTNYFPFHMVEELPMALSPIDPVYPEEARRLAIEGRVSVLIYIDETGTVRKVEVLKSPDESLSRAAVQAILNTKFKPARINGREQPVVMQFTIRFKLQ